MDMNFKLEKCRK